VTRLGADLAVNYRQQNFVDEAKTFTSGAGVDVIVENVAAEDFSRDFDAISRFGRIVIVGTGTGRSAETKFNSYSGLTKDLTVFGMSLVNAGSHVPEMGASLNQLFEQKKLKVLISKSYSLPQAGEGSKRSSRGTSLWEARTRSNLRLVSARLFSDHQYRPFRGGAVNS
jgi:NADPH:quinone reductase